MSLIDHLAKSEKRPKRDQLTQNGSFSTHHQTTTANSIQNNVHSSQSSLINAHQQHPINNNNNSASLQNLSTNSASNSIGANNSQSSLTAQHFAACAAAAAAQQHLNHTFGLQATTNNLLNHNNSFLNSLANNTLNGQFDHTNTPNIHNHVQHNFQHLHSALPLAHPHSAFLANIAALQRH